MKRTVFDIGSIPAILYGEKAERVFLFIHGKCGCKEEGGDFAELACSRGWQVLAVDLPGHGVRTQEMENFNPWHMVPELRTVMAYARERWQHVALRANSIGAWFSMLAFGQEPLEISMFVSPILDMARLIETMMQWAGVTEAELQAKETIPTAFGETLSWQYYQYAKTHPIEQWSRQTAMLYAGRDNLTPRWEAETFAARFHWDLDIMEEGEHWFHTPEQLAVLYRWTEDHLPDNAPVTEVVAALIQDGDRFLACQRPANKTRGLLWEFVGGKVEPEETREQALVRECQEELDVTLDVGEVFLDVIHAYQDLTVHLTVFRAAIAKGVPKKLEHNDIRWITVKEAETYPFCPADQVILERMREV